MSKTAVSKTAVTGTITPTPTIHPVSIVKTKDHHTTVTIQNGGKYGENYHTATNQHKTTAVAESIQISSAASKGDPAAMIMAALAILIL